MNGPRGWSRVQWLLTVTAIVAATAFAWSLGLMLYALVTRDWGMFFQIGSPWLSATVSIWALCVLPRRWLQASPALLRIEVTPGAIRGRAGNFDVWSHWKDNVGDASIDEISDGAGVLSVFDRKHQPLYTGTVANARDIAWRIVDAWPDVPLRYAYEARQDRELTTYERPAWRLFLVVSGVWLFCFLCLYFGAPVHLYINLILICLIAMEFASAHKEHFPREVSEVFSLKAALMFTGLWIAMALVQHIT